MPPSSRSTATASRSTRRATVAGGTLTVSVPRDRVDEFLKSLPRHETADGANLVMKLQLPTWDPADVVLTDVTEAPAWQPS